MFFTVIWWREESNQALQPSPRTSISTLAKLTIVWESFGKREACQISLNFCFRWAVPGSCLSPDSSFCMDGLEPQGTALTAGHFDRRIRSVFFQPSICATSQDAKVWRIPLTTLGAREWSDYGLLLWKKLGSCCWAAPWGVILALLFWDGNQNVPLQTDSVSQRLPEKTEDGQTRVSMILIKFVCFYAKEWCLFSL